MLGYYTEYGDDWGFQTGHFTSHPPQPFWVLGSHYLDVSHANCFQLDVQPHIKSNNLHPVSPFLKTSICVELNEKRGAKGRSVGTEEEEVQVKGCLINLKRAQ